MLRPCIEVIDGKHCPNLTTRTRCPNCQHALNRRTWATKSERYDTVSIHA